MLKSITGAKRSETRVVEEPPIALSRPSQAPSPVPLSVPVPMPVSMPAPMPVPVTTSYQNAYIDTNILEMPMDDYDQDQDHETQLPYTIDTTLSYDYYVQH